MLKTIRKPAHSIVSAAVFAVVLVSTARSGEAASIKTLKPGVLQVCLYPGFKPFTWQEGNVWKGWDVDYLEKFAADNRLTFKGVPVKEFNGIWSLPGERRCDIAASGISDTKKRRDDAHGVDWSKTYYVVVRAYLIRTGDKLEKIEDLVGKTVIVTKGSTADTDLQNRLLQAGISAKVTILYTDSEAAAADEVSHRKAFAYGGGYGSVKALAPDGSGLEVVWPHCNMVMAGKELQEVPEPFSFVVRTEDTGLTAALDAYIPGHPYPGTPNPPSVKCVPR